MRHGYVFKVTNQQVAANARWESVEFCFRSLDSQAQLVVGSSSRNRMNIIHVNASWFLVKIRTWKLYHIKSWERLYSCFGIYCSTQAKVLDAWTNILLKITLRHGTSYPYFLMILCWSHAIKPKEIRDIKQFIEIARRKDASRESKCHTDPLHSVWPINPYSPVYRGTHKKDCRKDCRGQATNKVQSSLLTVPLHIICRWPREGGETEAKSATWWVPE